MDTKKILIASAIGVAGIVIARNNVAADTEPTKTIHARILDINGIPIPHNSPIPLEEGGTYSLEVTITNTSYRGPTAVPAALRTTINASIDGMQLLNVDQTYDYSALAQNTVLYPFTVPWNVQGDSVFYITVIDPAGTILANLLVQSTISYVEIEYGADIDVPGADTGGEITTKPYIPPEPTPEPSPVYEDPGVEPEK